MALCTRVYFGLVGFSIVGSLVSANAGINPGAVRPLVAAATLIVGFWCIFGALPRTIGAKKAWGAMIATLGLGATVEIVGLYTGFPFGRYTYTDQWQPVVALPGGHFFPLLLPLAWFVVAGGSFLALSRWFGPRLSVFLTGILAATIDLVMEPVMTHTLDYWRWLEPVILGGAPMANFFGWLVTSWLAAWALYAVQAHKAAMHSQAVPVLVGHTLMVVALGLIG